MLLMTFIFGLLVPCFCMVNNEDNSNTENSSSLIDLTEEFNPVETCITHPHHCKNVYKYLVYMKSSSLWMRRLDRPEPSNPILMKFQVFSYVDLYHLAGIEYSEKRKSFFYADCLHFREVPALDLDNEIDFMTKNSSRQCFGYLAYDDKVDTIFYIVYQVHLKMYALIKHDMTKKNDDRGVQLMKLNHERPIAVVIHEDKALVYLASISKETNRGWIEKMDYFGQGGKVNLDEDVRSLALDAKEDRFYFTTRSGELKSADLDGQNVRTLTSHVPTRNTHNIVIDNDWIYIKNRTSIWRLNRNNSDIENEVVPHDDESLLISSMKIVMKPENSYVERKYLLSREPKCERICVHIDSDGFHTEETGKYDISGQCQCSQKDIL
ncbi:uncharacterized protein LOC106648839 [Trichogramma pretiosum]|uniref:uncharacterized protein LOC106648839 n=1 Tax=Trichogramma pretiosum TaxID=7493 RepID=UPI0006C9538D|nr:uncharacterized protein LOC106648839 [Trichogramma pretiosum]